MPLTRTAGTTIRSTDEALVLARQVIDQDQTALWNSELAADISCRSGCTACCHQAVPVGLAELRSLRQAIAELKPATRGRVEERIVSTATQLRTAGFDADDLNQRSGDARHQRAADYFDLQLPCPLLDDGTCVTRDARPLACREYLVTSDPEHCTTLPSSNVVRFRSRRDVLGNFARLEQRAEEPNAFILALALDGEIPSSPVRAPMATRDVFAALTATHNVPEAEVS